MLGLDSAQRIPLQDNSVYKFVCRYLSQEPPKNIILTELQAYDAKGIDVVLVYEDGASDFVTGGETEAKLHGDIALQEITALGLRSTGRHTPPVYAAVDVNLSPSQYAQTWANICTFASSFPRAVYGPEAFLDYCKAQEPAVYTWASAGWRKTTPTGYNIVQMTSQVVIGGVTCDQNASFTDDYGQIPALPQPTYPTPFGDNMQEASLILPIGLDANGDGHYPIASLGIKGLSDVNQIYNVLWNVGDPASAQKYDKIPKWGRDADSLVVTEGSPDAKYGCTIIFA